MRGGERASDEGKRVRQAEGRPGLAAQRKPSGRRDFRRTMHARLVDAARQGGNHRNPIHLPDVATVSFKGRHLTSTNICAQTSGKVLSASDRRETCLGGSPNILDGDIATFLTPD